MIAYHWSMTIDTLTTSIWGTFKSLTPASTFANLTPTLLYPSGEASTLSVSKGLNFEISCQKKMSNWGRTWKVNILSRFFCFSWHLEIFIYSASRYHRWRKQFRYFGKRGNASHPNLQGQRQSANANHMAEGRWKTHSPLSKRQWKN